MFLENASRKGWIEVVCGSMFSGKTEELIRRLKRAKFAHQRVEIFKPRIDVRYSEEEVVSHDANAIRSTPFIILLVAIIPFTRIVAGTSIGTTAAIVPLTIAAAPFIARLVETSLREVDKGLIEAAQSMGTSDFGIIRKVMIPEAKPALIVGAVISTVTVLGYSAMAATIGGGGLGGIAIIWGHQRSHEDIIWVCVLLIVLIVQVIQELGMLLARKTDRRVRK